MQAHPGSKRARRACREGALGDSHVADPDHGADRRRRGGGPRGHRHRHVEPGFPARGRHHPHPLDLGSDRGGHASSRIHLRHRIQRGADQRGNGLRDRRAGPRHARRGDRGGERPRHRQLRGVLPVRGHRSGGGSLRREDHLPEHRDRGRRELHLPESGFAREARGGESQPGHAGRSPRRHARARPDAERAHRAGKDHRDRGRERGELRPSWAGDRDARDPAVHGRPGHGERLRAPLGLVLRVEPDLADGHDAGRKHAGTGRDGTEPARAEHDGRLHRHPKRHDPHDQRGPGDPGADLRRKRVASSGQRGVDLHVHAGLSRRRRTGGHLHLRERPRRRERPPGGLDPGGHERGHHRLAR